MPAQLITYDLVSPGRDYSKLHDAIKNLGSWWHCIESTWIVDTLASTSSIRDTLTAHIDGNDKLLVVQLQGNWASMHLSDDCNRWMKEHVAR
jgi:hypothetical protein